MEFQFCKLLDQDVLVVAYVYEPLWIGYPFEGSVHKYIPDFLVYRVGTGWQLVEVRPLNRQNDLRSVAKWSAARAWCESCGMEFVLELGEHSMRHRNWEFIHNSDRVGFLPVAIGGELVGENG